MTRKRWQIIHAPPKLEPLCPPGMEVIDGTVRSTPVIDRGPNGSGYTNEADAIWTLITLHEDLVEKLHKRLGELDET